MEALILGGYLLLWLLSTALFLVPGIYLAATAQIPSWIPGWLKWPTGMRCSLKSAERSVVRKSGVAGVFVWLLFALVLLVFGAIVPVPGIPTMALLAGGLLTLVAAMALILNWATTPPTRSAVTVWAEDLSMGRLPQVSPLSGAVATASRRFKYSTAPAWTRWLTATSVLVPVVWIPGMLIRLLVTKRVSGPIHLTPAEIAGIRNKQVTTYGLLAATVALTVLSFVLSGNQAAPTALLVVLALLAFAGFIAGVVFWLARIPPRAIVTEPQAGRLAVEILDVHPSFAAAVALMYEQAALTAQAMEPKTVDSDNMPTGATPAEVVRRAQSGYRSDIAALGTALAAFDVFAPLAEPTTFGDGKHVLAADATVKLHDLTAPDTRRWIPLFTSVQALRLAGQQQGWTTGGGSLRFLSFNGIGGAQSVFSPALEAGAKAGVVFDVGQPSELAMEAVEFLAMVRGEAIPLVGYASRQPTRANEEVFVGEPAVPPSAAVLGAISAVLSPEPSVIAHGVLQVFIPERDVTGHLLLDIRAQVPESERLRISQRVGAAIAGLELPPPGYLDVAFNFGGSAQSAEDRR